MVIIFRIFTALFFTRVLLGAEPAQLSTLHDYPKLLNNTSHDRVIALLEGKQPVIVGVKKAKVTPGFGATWDFKTVLRQGAGNHDGVYKKRLKYLQYLLGIACKQPTQTRWGCFQPYCLDILKIIPHSWELCKATAYSHFLDDQRIYTYSIINRAKNPEYQFSDGILFKNEEGNICYKVTEPEAIPLVWHMFKLQTKNPPLSFDDYKKTILHWLKNPHLSGQAKKIIHFDVAQQSLLSITKPTLGGSNESKDTYVSSNDFDAQLATLTPEDHKKIKGALANLSHFKQLSSFLHAYAHIKRTTMLELSSAQGKILFPSSIDQLSTQIACYSSVFDDIEREYGIINDRINQELKISPIPAHIPKKKNKHPHERKTASDAAQSMLAKQPMQASQIHEPEETKPVAHAPITYHPRVKKWFNRRYTHYLPQSSVRYHTLLPLAYDEVIIAHGERNPWPNRTRAGQIDTSYQIPGTVTFHDEGSKETYLFELCINPQGQCYHRGCKKISLEQLLQSHQIEIDAQENALIDAQHENDQIDEPMTPSGTIEHESPYWITIRNADYNCSISFLKSNSGVH